jgi:integrase
MMAAIDLAVVGTEYTSKRLRWASPGTRRKFARVVREFSRFLGRMATTSDLEPDLVLDWLQSIDRSPHTVNEQRAKLVALWQYAARAGIVAKFPDVPKLRTPRRLPVAFGVPEFARLLAAAREQSLPVCGVPGELWWPALLLLGWATGERFRALTGFRWADYDPASGRLVARAETRKGQDADRLYLLPPWARQAIEALPRAWPEILHHSTSYWLRWNDLLKRAGLPADRWHKTHALRRSHASHLAAAGLDASAALGHSSPLVTRQHYLDPTIVGENRAGLSMPMPIIPPTA